MNITMKKIKAAILVFDILTGLLRCLVYVNKHGLADKVMSGAVVNDESVGGQQSPVKDVEQKKIAQDNYDDMLYLTPQEGLVLHSTINRK